MPCAFGSFWKVKDGHLTRLTDCPFIQSGQSTQTGKTKSVMVWVTYEIFRKYIVTKRKKESGMEPVTVTIVGSG